MQSVLFLGKDKDTVKISLYLTKHHAIKTFLVGIALGYGLDVRGSRVRFPAGAGNFSLHHRVQNVSGPIQPPIRGLFPWE
jgi:hypothetical protein